jgi:uncharacterized membrane protein YbhN (UPF0104 family)
MSGGSDDDDPSESPSSELEREVDELEVEEAEVLERTRFNVRTVLSITWRIGLSLGAVALAIVVLARIFDDLDLDQIREAFRELSDAEWISLLFGWLIWIGTQGLQTASLVTGLPARRGVLASLGPRAIASVIPGPSDLPMRYAMYQSWGVSTNEAATAVAASGIFSIGSQLALPALAGVLIFFGDVQLSGFGSVIIITTLVLAVAIVVIAFVLGSDRRTRWAGDRLDGPARRVRRLFRKDPPARPMGDVLADQRRLTVDYLRDKWPATTAATILTVAAKCSLLIMSLRWMGIPEADLSWREIFAVFAIVAGLNTIPIMPGGAGVSEVAYVGMLTPLAGSQWVNQVVAGVLLYRILTWLALIPTGLIALGVWKYSVRDSGDVAESVT